MKLAKIHGVLEFDQSSWLTPYIDFNTKMRMSGKNAFEKDFFKVMNNSVFGKTMENLRKRINVKLVTDYEKFTAMISKPSCVGWRTFSNELAAVQKIKERLILNKPAYVGMCILDLIKVLM